MPAKSLLPAVETESARLQNFVAVENAFRTGG